MLYLIIFCPLALFSIRFTVAEEHIVPLTKEFVALLDDERRYNKYATPTQDKGIATNVSMSMFIEGISSFSAQTMDYHLDMYFYQEWKDERLRHNGSGPLLIRDKQVFKKLWHPDIYFANAKQASFQEVTEDNFLIWIYPNGRVWYDCRISLVAICMMDLWKYPLDSQMCELRILSYAYSETLLRLKWSTRINPAIDRNMDIKMPDMNLVDIDTGQCNGTYATGTWSCMTVIFYVERAMLHHIIQTYVPTALIVIISWFNFWLDIDSAPARVSLSITTLLTIATQANAVKLALPEVSYMKAIDSWMGMCMAFVFAVMVEYTIAHFAKNQEHLFQFGQQCMQPPLVVDSCTLHSLLGAAAAGAPAGSSPDPELLDDPILEEQELEQFLTSEQLHRLEAIRAKNSGEKMHWRKKVCGVLANGTLKGGGSFRRHRNNQNGGPGNNNNNSNMAMNNMPNMMRPSMSARSFRCRNGDNNKLDEEATEKDLESEVSSSILSPEEELQRKISRNYLSADFNTCETEEARMAKKISRSLPGGPSFQYSDEPLMIPPHAVHRKNSFRESATRIRNHVNKRALLIKRTLNQLRGREMANKIDQKSRILFPLAFFIVNVCYWSYYLILN